MSLPPSDEEAPSTSLKGDRGEGMGPPCSVLWTPIQPLTCCIPFVGHMGITDSAGRLHDWGGGPIHPCPPDQMLFGAPARYISYSPQSLEKWDEAVAQADEEYRHKIHCMVCGSDCHSHTARALDLSNAGGCACHNKVELAAHVFFCGRHVGMGGFLKTWSGFALLAGIWYLTHL